MNLAVLISGGGTTLQNLLARTSAGQLDARVTVVVCSNEKSHAVALERWPQLPVHLAKRKDFDSTQAFSDSVFALIRDAQADIVCLAGFLSLLALPDDYADRVLNIHPALLPSFGGKGFFGHHVHEAVLAHGCKVSGCTVHFADQTYDTGPIIVQRTCPVLESDSPDDLAARVFEQECEAYPEAINLMADGRVLLDGRRTRIAPALTGDLASDARAYAAFAHKGQTSADGRPYANHPIRVAELLRNRAGIRDPAILAAAYLHDVFEDTTATPFHLRQAFGRRIADAVEELTVPTGVREDFDTRHLYIIRHASGMSDAAKLIKLGDRLDHLLSDRPRGKRPEYIKMTQELLEAMKPWPGAGDAVADAIREETDPP